jgi:ADP-ribose pyrophosphatase YjhB (NUDIX family)
MVNQSSETPMELTSAGGVVFRYMGDDVEVVLCGRTLPEEWRLPKGTPDLGETLQETALREVQEETGLEIEIVEILDQITYWFSRPEDGMRFHKTVHFYLMTPIGGSLEFHDAEFDEVRWFSAKIAVQRLSFLEERRMVEEAVRLVSRGVHERH